LDPPKAWEVPLSGGIPYENGPPGGVWKAVEVDPEMVPEPIPEVEGGLTILPSAAVVPPKGGVFTSPLILDPIMLREWGFLRDILLNELVISSNKFSVSESD